MKKKHLLLLSCALSAALLTAAPQAFAKDNLPAATIQVTGSGEFKVTPDLAVLSFEVSAYEGDAKSARQKVEETVSAFTGRLASLKLGDKAVAAQSLTVSPRYESKDGKVERIMYNASRYVTVKLENFDLIADVTDMAIDSGINEVSRFSYELKDPKSAQKQARLNAVADAKEKAAELAEAFEVKLGKPLSLSYEMQGNIIAPRNTMMLRAAAMDSSEASGSIYMVDDLTINAQVYATFEIKD